MYFSMKLRPLFHVGFDIKICKKVDHQSSLRQVDPQESFGVGTVGVEKRNDERKENEAVLHLEETL
jgi:hypothetical protein